GHRSLSVAGRTREPWRFQQFLLHTRRSGGPVLAHRRHDLDLSVPVVLLDLMSTENHTEAHHGGPKIYTANLFALLFLTVITVAAASFNFGSANVVIALAIASVIAILVGLFFMHLLWDKPVNAIILIAAFLFLGIFLM